MKEEYSCVYGSGHIPDTIYVYDGWYVVDGSSNVNHTRDEFYDGVDVELLEDDDYFSWSSDINSYEDLVAAVEA